MVERRYTRVGGYRIHSAQSGTGPPVILMHGLSGSQGWWRYTMSELAREYTVIAPELIGFGRTTKPRVLPRVPELAVIMAEWAARLGIEAAHVVGHSMGGQLSMHLAATVPALVRRLVLVAPAGIPRELGSAALFRLAAELVPPRRWGRLRFLPTIALDAARAGPRVLVIALQHLLADDVRPLLPGITQPTLLIWGALDPLVPLAHGELMNELLPDARLLVLEDAAHNPMVDRPPGGGQVVILVHGLGLSSRIYDCNCEELAGAGFRVIAPDLPGFGGTPGPRRSLGVMESAAWLADFARALGLDHAAWIGHSLSCQSVMALAGAEPHLADAIVLIAPTGAPERGRRVRQLFRFARNVPREPLWAVLAVAREYLRTSPRKYFGTWLKAFRDRPLTSLAAIRCPALIVIGTHDPVIPRSYLSLLASGMANATIEEIPGGAHGLPFDRRREMDRRVIAWLRQVFSRGSVGAGHFAG